MGRGLQGLRMTRGFIREVWSFTLIWSADFNTVGQTSSEASSTELFAYQLLHASATLMQQQL